MFIHKLCLAFDDMVYGFKDFPFTRKSAVEIQRKLLTEDAHKGSAQLTNCLFVVYSKTISLLLLNCQASLYSSSSRHGIAGLASVIRTISLALIARHLAAVGLSQVQLAGGQVFFLRDLPFSPHHMIISALNG